MHLLRNERETEVIGAALAGVLAGQGAVVTLAGELGAGKTTLARGLLRALGHTGAVKSPTYTLIEPYELTAGTVLHLDLYRLASATDLDALGLREALDGTALILIEWPERAAGALPAADLALRLATHPDGRELHAEAGSALGRRCLQVIDSIWNKS